MLARLIAEHPNIYQIAAPFEGDGLVNCYLIDAPRRALIDTGTASVPGQTLLPALKELGWDVADLIVPSGHRLGETTTLAQIGDERWISAKAGDICHEWLVRVLPGVQPDFHVGEFETQLTLIAAGLGVAIIPRLARPARLPADVRVVTINPAPRRRVVVAWREAAAARPAIKAAERALRESWDQASAARASRTVNAPA